MSCFRKTLIKALFRLESYTVLRHKSVKSQAPLVRVLGSWHLTETESFKTWVHREGFQDIYTVHSSCKNSNLLILHNPLRKAN